jgi:hypothetical protein
VRERYHRLPAMRAEWPGVVFTNEVVEEDCHWRCFPLRLFREHHNAAAIREGKPL